MTDPLIVKEAEYGTLRVFALDLPDAQQDALDASFLQPLIGATYFRPEKAEIVEISKLGDLGLAGYLTAGYGITATEVQTNAQRLSDAAGHVALVPASAFDGKAQHLEPKAPAHFIGLYHEESAEPTAPMAPSVRQPQPTPAPDTLSEGPKRKGRPVVYVICAGILVLLLLLLLL